MAAALSDDGPDDTLTAPGGVPSPRPSLPTPPAVEGAFDEWRGRAAGRAVPDDTGSAAAADAPSPGAHWAQFSASLGPRGWAELSARAQSVRRRVREDGVTYNVYADADASGAGHSRLWPLEVLPAIVPADDWAEIERGVVQRARLLEAAMADIYGPQQLLREALLPASLVYGHPQYLRPAHGLLPAGRRHLHLVAFDLARDGAGRFRVLVQRTQTPSGLGYLLENRLIIAPQLQAQFSALHVQRLASSFRLLIDALMQASPAGHRSRIVLLTPGPLNETYFEQAFLSRYLGIALVEGHDLTVRGQRLYLKTLQGLEQVHVVLRRVDDEYLDPLELRADSALGVPGLLQAVRAGQVLLANAPGAGVLESPGLAAFWPAVARHLLGEDLRMPAFTSWWCGEDAVWQAQRDRLADFVVAPTFQHAGFGPRVVASLPPDEQARLRAAIDAEPAAYTLQAPVRPSETPVWHGGRLEPRAAVLRVFVLADGQGGWRVLPGAFTRVAAVPSSGRGPVRPDPWLSMQHGSASVDTWVITRDAVDTSSLLPRALTMQDLAAGWRRTVTSRAGENLFWLGRYTERAENAVRLTRLALEAGPDAPARVAQWLMQLLRWHGLVAAAPVPPGGRPSPTLDRRLIEGLRDDGRGAGLADSLKRLRACAMALRERLSPEHWRLIQEVEGHFRQHAADVLGQVEQGVAALPEVLGMLGRTATHLCAITGAQTDRMTRDHGWRLLSVGRQIERLDVLAHALASAVEQRVHEMDEGFDLVLGLFDSLITYRAQFQARRELLPLLHLLAIDTDNPRSLAWVARTMRERLRKLVPAEQDWPDLLSAAASWPESWPLEALAAPDRVRGHADLARALQQLGAHARLLSDEISRHLFVHAAGADRQVWQ